MAELGSSRDADPGRRRANVQAGEDAVGVRAYANVAQVDGEAGPGVGGGGTAQAVGEQRLGGMMSWRRATTP